MSEIERQVRSWWDRLLLGHLPMTDEFIAEVVDVILAGVTRPG